MDLSITAEYKMSENFNFGRLESLGHASLMRDGYGELSRNGILVDQRDNDVNDVDMDLFMARIVGNALENEENFPPCSPSEVGGGGYTANNLVSMFDTDVTMMGRNGAGSPGWYLPAQAVRGGARSSDFMSRLSCSPSESLTDRSGGFVDCASDGSFSPFSNSASSPSPPRNDQFRSERVRSEWNQRGKMALFECQVVLLEIQKLRSDTAVAYGLRANGDQRDFILAVEPQAFTKQEVEMLLVFNMNQFDRLNELVKRLEERSVRPEQRMASHIWSQMDPGNSSSTSHQVPLLSPSPFAAPHQNSLRDAVDCPSFMRDWKTSAIRSIGILRCFSHVSDLTQLEAHDFNKVLNSLGKLREDIFTAQASFRTKYPIGENGPSARVLSRNSGLQQENNKFPTKPALPYRAEDEFPSSALRFPPSRKQRGTPKYSKNPGCRRFN